MDSNIPEVKLDVTPLGWRLVVLIELYMLWYGTLHWHDHCVSVFVSWKPVANGRRSLRIVAGA